MCDSSGIHTCMQFDILGTRVTLLYIWTKVFYIIITGINSLGLIKMQVIIWNDRLEKAGAGASSMRCLKMDWFRMRVTFLRQKKALVTTTISRSKTFCQPLKNQRFSAFHESVKAMKEADNIIKSRFRSFPSLEKKTDFSALLNVTF